MFNPYSMETNESSDNEMPELVQPLPDNITEQHIAFCIVTALQGNIFTSTYSEHVKLEQYLSEGALAEVRPEFRQNVIDVVIPELLEKATFSPEIFCKAKDDEEGQAFVKIAQSQVQSLIKALREANERLNS
jgi:hypothetical protein